MQLGPAGRVMAAFALHATSVGSLFVRLPEIQKALALSESTFGLVLLCTPVGVVLGSIVMARAVETWGPKRLLLVGLPLVAAILLLVGMATSAVMLGAALFVFGLGFATSNVAINVEADRVEAAQDRRIMSRCHGWWALGFLATTLTSAGLILVGVSPVMQFLGLTVLLVLLVPAILNPLPVSSPRASAAAARRFAFPGKGTLMIGAFALAGVVLEGTTRSWSVIYVRDIFGTADWLAALALPAIVVTQTAGRFLGDGMVERWGSVPVARAIALVMLAGTVVVTFAPGTAVVLFGFALIGAGVSIVIPQAFSAAARWGDRPAAESMAAFATLSTLMGFLGPPLFGAAAEWLGLRMAFALMIPLPLLSLAFAGYLGVAAGLSKPSAPQP
jgi:MFS family permease